MSSDARTASSSPLTAPSVLTDEAALKRTFDSEYTSALASARSQLGDATALAPRVVEAAFVSAWNQRTTLPTHEDVKRVIADEIRHGSARALSRRASAGRFAGGKHATGQHATASDAPADVWARVDKAIRTTGEDAHAAAADAGRHEAASHMKAVGKKKSLVIPVLVGVVAIAAAIGGVMYVNHLGVDDAALSAVSGSTMLPTVQSGPGQKQVAPTTLSDGSKIRVGPETKLYIPDGFPKKVRAIRVDGTVTVDVAPVTADMPLPFRIVAKRMHFIATGTSFSVSAYPGDSAVLLQVKEGSVTVKAGKTTTVVPAGQAMIAENGAVRAATADERIEGLGWVDGQLVVKNKQLKEMAAALTRWFAYDVKVIDQPLFERRASIDVPLDSSRLAISQVETTANVKFAYEGETKVFRDAAKANATKANATKANVTKANATKANAKKK